MSPKWMSYTVCKYPYVCAHMQHKHIVHTGNTYRNKNVHLIQTQKCTYVSRIHNIQKESGIKDMGTLLDDQVLLLMAQQWASTKDTMCYTSLS